MAVVIKPSGPVIGLDIGSTQTKVVEARSTRDGIQISGLAVVPTPEELYLQGTIIDQKELGKFIKQLLDQRKMQGKTVVSAISGQSSVVVRIVEMSKMSDKELKDTMKWEVERHVPFAANDVEMDFVPIPNPTAASDAQTMEVLLVVAQREAVNLHLEVLAAAGLKPTAIDVGPLAAGRAIIDTGDPALRSGTVAIINIGLSTTDVSIFRNGVLVFTRPMPLAGETFTRAISQTLGKTPEEAEELKRRHASVLLDKTAGGARPLELDVAPAPAEPAQPTIAANGFADLSQPLGLLGNAAPAPPDEPEVTLSRSSFELSGNASGAQVYDLGADLQPPPAANTGDAPESIFDLETIAPSRANLGNGPVIIKPTEEVAPERSALEGLGITEQIFHAIEGVLSDFVTELRRSLDYYRSRSGGEAISKIVLCGGGSRIPNLDTYLAGELSIVVDVPSLGPKIQCTYKGYTADELKDALPVIPVSLGLAIRNMVDEEEPAKPKAAKPQKVA